MQKLNNNLCIRCGKMRIIANSWSDYVGTSLVTYTINVCPDPECQKIVDDQLKKKKDKFDTIQKDSLKRREEIRKNRRSKRLKT